MCYVRTTLIALMCVGLALHASEQNPPVADAAAMEMMKAGPEHQQLQKLVGNWDVACQCWNPGGKQQDDSSKPTISTNTKTAMAKPMESKATATYKSVYDGRFVQGEFKGEMMGKPFTGTSVLGYDRAAQKYVSVWYDSMTTGVFTAMGTSEDDGKTITYTGETTCPQEGGKAMSIRQVETHQSDDRFTLEMFGTMDGKEQKMMQMTYTRNK